MLARFGQVVGFGEMLTQRKGAAQQEPNDEQGGGDEKLAALSDVLIFGNISRHGRQSTHLANGGEERTAWCSTPDLMK